MSLGLLQRLGGVRGWRLVAALGLLAVIGGGTWIAVAANGSARASVVSAVADRGTIAVTVTGSGQVNAAGIVAGTSAAGAKAAASSPAGSGVLGGIQVFAHTSGQLLKLLVTPGQTVAAGQPLALLGDPTAADGVLQAQLNVQSALAQSASAGQLTVGLARQKLGALAVPSKPALSQARLDVATAKAAYETLLRAPVPPTQGARAGVKLAVTLAQQKLAALYQPSSQATLLAAQLAVTQAQAKLHALRAVPPPPAASEVRAAELALKLAQQQLAGLSTPIATERTSAELAVAQAQAKLDALHAVPPPPDPAAVAAAEQEIALATQNLAALATPLPTQPDVTAAQRDLHAANQKLADLQASGSPSAADLAAAQQGVADATRHLSELMASPRLTAFSQAQLDLRNAKLALEALLRAPVRPSRTAVAAANLAVKLATGKLVQLTGHPGGATLAQAKLDIATATAGMQTDQLKLAAARGSLQLARLRASSLVVRAPVAGTVTNVLATPGAQVDPTVAIAVVADLNRLSVTVNMSEFDVANVKIGNPAVVSVGALGGTAIPARVSAISPVGVSNGGVVQFPVTVALNAAPKKLRPGMLASVQVTTARRSGVVRVPLDAISFVVGGSNDGSSQVTVLDKGGRQTSKLVDLGLAGSSMVQVVRGVKPGERVLLVQATAAASGASGAPGSNAPAGIGVPPATPDQGGGGGGGG